MTEKSWLEQEKGPPYDMAEWDETWTDDDYRAWFRERNGYEAKEVKRYPGVGVLVGPLKESN